ncbi:alpha/beta hydrolase [Telluribacter humicola]|uniref:alpha/beta hydrolase n=1 Tax=Telluribacter humicola TaxID=1720261 RepID=UPI001A96432B|nr:alpha/beta hydrolase [Telluribacter humicola]
MSTKWTKWKIIRTVWVAAGLGFMVWLWSGMQADGVGEEILRSDAAVEVTETEDYISFTPTSTSSKVLLFYPGALVDPVAYAPLCRKVAASGCPVYLIKMPWRLALNGYTKPKEIGLLGDTTKQYLLAGHSQGAKMAAQFVYENPSLIDKLILLGTTHPRDIDLSTSQIPILKIQGTHDGVAAVEEMNRNKSKLPSTTKYVLIEGGNHTQFGFYGYQLGDSEASISREQQQQMVLDSIISFVRE